MVLTSSQYPQAVVISAFQALAGWITYNYKRLYLLLIDAALFGLG